MKELQMLEQKLNNESAADDSASAHLRKTDCYVLFFCAAEHFKL